MKTFNKAESQEEAKKRCKGKDYNTTHANVHISFTLGIDRLKLDLIRVVPAMNISHLNWNPKMSRNHSHSFNIAVYIYDVYMMYIVYYCILYYFIMLYFALVMVVLASGRIVGKGPDDR